MAFFHLPVSRNSRRRPAAIVVMTTFVMAATLATIVHSAPSASAAAKQCKRDNICVFTKPDYKGATWTVPAFSSGTCLNLADWHGGRFNNSIRSYISNGEFGTFYDGPRCKGNRKKFTGTSDGSRAKNLLNWGSRIESIYFA